MYDKKFMANLQVQDLVVQFDERKPSSRALNHLSARFDAPFSVIVGAFGYGKTTLPLDPDLAFFRAHDGQ